MSELNISRVGRDGVGSAHAIVSGFCASLVGIGLARFAYTPLLPAIVDAGWFDASRAAYLGAANLAGYLAGALLGRTLAARASAPATIRAMMLLAAISFFASASPISFAWFFAWRLLSGLAGGALMVLAAPAVLPLVAPSRRGLAGGVIFMGVGAGVAASGTLVPLMLDQGLKQTWLGLGIISMALTAIAWRGWPRTGISAETPQRRAPGKLPAGALRVLFIEYGLNAAGWVPHMIFLVDYVSRGLGLGLRTGSNYWVLFGIGATLGPICAGLLADRIGFGRALRLAFILEIFGVLVPALRLGTGWLMISSVLVGAFVTGTVPLVLGRVHELLAHHPSLQNPAWRTATVSFALLQAAAAYMLSYVFSKSGGNYAMLFVIGAAAITIALVLDLISSRFFNRSPSQVN